MRGWSTFEIMAVVKTSGFLGTSLRQYELLEYLLKKTEQGLSDQVKAYSIALDVFGRSDDFENSQDSIVRVEMHRLRKNLNAFNSTSKLFTLEIPRATYLVELKRMPQRSVMIGKKSVLWLIISGVSLVTAGYFLGRVEFTKPFSPLCSAVLPNVTVVSQGNSEPLTGIVDRAFKMAFEQQSSLNLLGTEVRCDTDITPRYFVQIDTLNYEDKTNIVVFTSYNKAGNFIHSNAKNDAHFEELGDEMLFYAAVRIANDLGKVNGVIPRHASKARWKDNSVRDNYGCLVQMYDSFVTDSDADYQKSLRCLEASIERGTPLMDNIGGLAATYVDQIKGYREKTVADPIEAIEQLFESIEGEWIESAEATVAKISFLTETSKFSSERLKDILNVAEARYSLNVPVLIQISAASGLILGDWENAKRISNFVKHIHSERDNSVFLVDAAYALMNMVPEEAIKVCILTDSKYSVISNLVINACANYANDVFWVAKTRTNLRELGFETAGEMIAFIEGRNFDRGFIDKLVGGFQ